MNIDWDGKGLPPTGLEFEWRYGDRAWKQGKALYIGSVYAILQTCDAEQHYYIRDMQFRPVRTREQIAADKRLHEIRNACTAINSKVEGYNTNLDCSAAMRATIEAMIDAGYRKFEIVEEDV
ncbi:hypothetical protein D3C85_1468560 [compost metagenome]